MHAASTTLGPKRRALALGALTTALFAALLGLAAERGARGLHRQRRGGHADTHRQLRRTTSSCSQVDPGSPTSLQVDVGADGTADFNFDRTTFTAIEVEARRATTRCASTASARSRTRRSP